MPKTIEPAEAEIVEPTVTTLAPRTPGSVVLPAAGGEALVKAFEAYQATCEALLDETDYQTFEERGQSRRFRKRSGWRKLAIAYAVTFEIVEHRIYPNPAEGPPAYAEFTVRATAPNGRFADGWGACSIDERCCDDGCSRDHRHCSAATGDVCPPKRHFTKPRHDIPATAETRAKNRAAADLFGMGEVSAEEVTAEGATIRRQNIDPNAPKCPHCSSPVIDQRNQPDPEPGKKRKPAWACSNRGCGGGGKKKDSNEHWPWGTYDPKHFDEPLTATVTEGADLVDRLHRLVAVNILHIDDTAPLGQRSSVMDQAETIVLEAANSLGIGWPDPAITAEQANDLYREAWAIQAPDPDDDSVGYSDYH